MILSANITASIIQGSGSPPPPSYDPATDTNALAVWESDSNVTTGDTFSWTDRTTNAYVASQATSANQPLLVSSQLNGLPAIRFGSTAGTDYLTVASTVLLASTNPFSIFFIIRPTSGNVSNYNNTMAFQMPDIPTDSFLFSYNSSLGSGYSGNPFWGGSIANWNTDAYGPNLSAGGFTYNTSNFQVWAITYNGSGLGSAANFAMIQAGTNLGCITAPDSLTAISLNMIGSSNSGGKPEHDLCAVYVFKVVLNGSEYSNFQSYISTKWGLTT